MRGGVGELFGRGRWILGDKLQQRQITSCIPENFSENLCLCNRILLSQQVVQIQSDLIISRLVAATKFCCGDKDFHKHSPCRPHQAICRYDVTPQRVAESPDLHTRSDLSPRRIAATCGLVCSDFVREQHALKWSFKFNQNSEMQLI